MIKPTVGRVVLFHAPATPDIVNAAIIVCVNSDTNVNLSVFDKNGHLYPTSSVILLQDDATPPESGMYCEWMPYQKGQAAKTEQAETDEHTIVSAFQARIENLEAALAKLTTQPAPPGAGSPAPSGAASGQ